MNRPAIAHHRSNFDKIASLAAACALLTSFTGCQNGVPNSFQNPFLAPDRVPPPGTRTVPPGTAQPYYPGDPVQALQSPGQVSVGDFGTPLQTTAQPTYGQPIPTGPLQPVGSFPIGGTHRGGTTPTANVTQLSDSGYSSGIPSGASGQVIPPVDRQDVRLATSESEKGTSQSSGITPAYWRSPGVVGNRPPTQFATPVAATSAASNQALSTLPVPQTNLSTISQNTVVPGTAIAPAQPPIHMPGQPAFGYQTVAPYQGAMGQGATGYRPVTPLNGTWPAGANVSVLASPNHYATSAGQVSGGHRATIGSSPWYVTPNGATAVSSLPSGAGDGFRPRGQLR